MKYKCKECNNTICNITFKYGSGLCRHCVFKGERNPSFKHGEYCNDYYCIICNKKLYFKTKTAKCKYCSRLGNTNAKNSGYNKIGKLNPNFGKSCAHAKHGKYKGNYMRSTWEIKFAYFLDCSGIKWIYEPKRFYFKDCTYLPDFYLPEFDCYIEIKGYWRFNTKKRFDLFKKYYPKTNVKLLMKKELQELGILK